MQQPPQPRNASHKRRSDYQCRDNGDWRWPDEPRRDDRYNVEQEL